jgi:cobalt-zinc-cadmium efflux system outer membrane protein
MKKQKEGTAMRILKLALMTFAAGNIYFAGQAGAQEMQMPAQDHAHTEQHSDAPPQAIFPRMGRSQENAPALFTLDSAQRMTAETNPTLRQAEDQIRASKARQHQAGLYPNPTVGYVGDEIRGGSVGGGKQGFFVQQTIVTGGKLSRSEEVYAKDLRIAEIEAEEQKLRVQDAVKTAFYRVLAAQELLDARRDLAKIEQQYTETQRRLFNSGQTDETELLDYEIDAQRMRLQVRMQENSLHEEWRSLAALMGRPDLPQSVLSGDLEHGWPELDENQIVEEIASKSPAVSIAEAGQLRAQSEIEQAKRLYIPDLQVRGGMEYNNDLLGAAPHAKGWEGLAEVSVQVPLFNRNQGNVAAAAQEVDRATLEKRRIALTLRSRAASVVDEYSSAKLMAMEYRDEILPRAKKSYSLMLQKYGEMLASPPRVIERQRKLYELYTQYIMALETVWSTGIALQGYLLTDGLEAPARPGDVDRPMRETNVPERMASPGQSFPRP